MQRYEINTIEFLSFLNCKNNDIIIFNCIKCNNKKELQYRSIKNKKELVCRECTFSKNFKNFTKEKKENIRNKTLKTNYIKYNGPAPLSDKKIYKKSKKTMLEKYGYLNGGFANYNKFKEKKKNEFGSIENYNKIRKEKMKKTNLEKFGSTCSLHGINEEKIQKIKIEKYGTLFVTKKYTYNNIYFDSTWELAYYIWLIDHNIDFEFHPKIYFEYIDENNLKHKYFPDFRVDNKYIEFKGSQFFNKDGEPFDLYHKKFWWNKYNCMILNNVKIKKDANEYLKYVSNKYGKNYLKQFLTKK